MEIKSTWSNIKTDSKSINTLVEIVKQIPDNIEQLLSLDTSNLSKIVKEFENNDLNYNFINKTFIEAKSIIYHEIRPIQRILKIRINQLSKISKVKIINLKAKNAGLYGDSLTLKMGLLNKLWKNIVDYIDKTGLKIIDFGNTELVKLIRKFLSYLNSFLGSLKSVFPFIEAMIEFAGIIEASLDLAEEFKNV